MSTPNLPSPNEKSTSAAALPKVSFWFARIWQGMTLPVWLRLLARHRFRVAPSRLALSVRIDLFSIFNGLLSGVEQIAHGPQIKNAKVQPPLFVIGHWRTGTTWLHELLAL